MIGIDIEKIERFKKLTKTQQARIYTKKELEYCAKFDNPYPHLAGMWCVKEAFIKATKNKNVPLKSIEVLHKTSGAPYLNITKELEEYLSEEYSYIDISITHTDEIACAVVEIN